jgi:hypothetical protein
MMFLKYIRPVAKAAQSLSGSGVKNALRNESIFHQILFHLKSSWRAARFPPLTILAGKS